jgi:MYXO-CTERM domain-containing protein
LNQPRARWDCLVPSALIAALLSMGMGLAFVGPVEAAPSQELTGSAGPAADGPARVEGPQPRFQYRVTGQEATSTVTPTVTATPTSTSTPTRTPTATPVPLPAGGAFVIGNQNAVVGNSVTFWGAQWSNANSLSGGPAPASFKGFENSNPSPTCGGTWTAEPGNSAAPPSTIPPVMAVIASSSIRQTGATISGNIAQMVIVQTDPGYAPNPGHTGTGRIVGVICGPSVVSGTIIGDTDGDGFVDIRDYGVWRQNFGQTNCGNPADGDGNCLVDIRDYGMWRQHFGEGTPTDHRPGAALPAGISPAPGGTPGPAPLGSEQAVAGSWVPNEPNDSSPAVPIVPLVGGLLGLGGLAGWRRCRPPGT